MAHSHDHANVKPNRLNIANRAVKQMRKIIFGILKSAFPKKIRYEIGRCGGCGSNDSGIFTQNITDSLLKNASINVGNGIVDMLDVIMILEMALAVDGKA